MVLAINYAVPSQPYHEQAQSLMSLWAQNEVQLLAPPLYESEVDSTLRRFVYRGHLNHEAEQAAHRLLEALNVRIVHDSRVRRLARQIAQEFNQERVYDATYAALAELTGCELWTADREFYEAVKPALDYVRFLAAQS